MHPLKLSISAFRATTRRISALWKQKWEHLTMFHLKCWIASIQRVVICKFYFWVSGIVWLLYGPSHRIVLTTTLCTASDSFFGYPNSNSFVSIVGGRSELLLTFSYVDIHRSMATRINRFSNLFVSVGLTFHHLTGTISVATPKTLSRLYWRRTPGIGERCTYDTPIKAGFALTDNTSHFW